MNFSSIFNVFSKRDKLMEDKGVSLTPEFRNRIIKLWLDTFPKESESRWVLDRPSLWREVYDKLIFSLGTLRLSVTQEATHYINDLGNFLGECSDEHFLDFIELSFQSSAIRDSSVHVQDIIDAVNRFFQHDDLPYRLTDFVYAPERRRPGSRLPLGYQEHSLQSYPQIVRRDSDVLHETAIEPALTILREPAFSSANKEFLEALMDYRKGDYEDSVTKCGSSFESVMKVICKQKGWPVDREAAKLLNSILRNTELPPFLKQPLIQIATIRNELGSAHGAGAQPRRVSKHLAQYTINLTASAVLLLIGEVKP